MQKKINNSEIYSAGYSGLYLERGGVGSTELAEMLIHPPEYPLSEPEKEEVRQFEAEMLQKQVDTGMTLEDAMNLSMTESLTAPLFFAQAIIDGKVVLEGVEIPRLETADEVYKWIAQSNLPKKQLMELSKKTTEVYKAQAAEALIEDRPVVDSITEARSLVIDADEFTRRMRGLAAARTMLREWRATAPRGSSTDDAKLAYNDIFLAKINAQLAQGIPIVHYLREQADLVGNEHLAQRAESLVAPGLVRVFGQDDSRQKLFRRLDFLRNGIGYDESGDATSVAKEVATNHAEAPRGGLFTVEQMEQMKNTILTPDEMKQMFQSIISRANLLSSEDESTWSPQRTSRAHDGKFQVLINPGKATFEVDPTSGVYMVSSEPRSLYDAVIVGGFHELEHINQAIADDAVGQAVKVAQIKGKRVAGLREAGANVRQRQAESELFGYSKPYADTYASALRVLEEQGTTAQAIKAFYDAKLRAMPDTDKTSAAREAADRVLRLVRGGINSQPMVYAEESILTRQLQDASADVQKRALAVTGLDLVDQVRLHKFGLLDLPESSAIDWSSYILDELANKMKEKGVA